MKILPRKVDIDKIKSLEKKREIDDGIALASKIDTLRETRLAEEKNLMEWRENSIKSIQYQIDQKLEELANLKTQSDDARNARNELLKPLDNEWEKVSESQNKIDSEKKSIAESKKTIKQQTEKIKRELEKISVLISTLREKEEFIEKNHKEIISLKDLTQKEYEVARFEREYQNDTHEKLLIHVKSLEQEYENGLVINKLEKQHLLEVESDLKTREQELTRQQNQMKISWEEIKKHNGTS